MEFYAFLPSNACPELYPDNKTSHYKIQLSQRLDLSGKWQVALVQAHYPNTIAQVAESENEIIFCHRDGRRESFYVKTGYYSNVKDFVYALHEALTPVESKLDGHGRSSVVEVTPENYIMFHPCTNLRFAASTFSFSPRLAMQLGLAHPGPYPSQSELCGSNPIDMSLGVPPLLFVYVDKISDQIVGNCRAPLLATIPTSIGRYGSVTVHTFDHPLYFDLSTRNFDTIEINIRDHTGKFVSFNHGTSMLLCHFKSIQD